MTSDRVYRRLVSHYESCLERFGDTHRGVDWPNERDAQTRSSVMLNVVREADKPATLLDLGCGAAHLYEWMLRQDTRGVSYHGLDLSAKFIELSRRKHPECSFYEADLLTETDAVPSFDYIVMNGVLTEKRDLSYEQMWAYSRQLVSAAFRKARRGIAFNVMSMHVDRQRPDLFHVPHDTVASFVIAELSRHYVIRSDYGLYEHTTYVYHEPSGD